MWRRVGVGLLLLVGVAVLALLLREGLSGVRRTVAAAGFWGPMLFVLLHGVVCAIPVPRTVFTVAAGVLFGSLTGVLAALCGTALAASLSYLLATIVGGRLAERHAHLPAIAWVRRRVRHRGLLAMISLRLLPGVPFCLMNYVLALSGARNLSFLLSTVLGALPGTITMVVLGDAAVGGNPHPVMFAVSAVSAAVGVTGAIVAARRPLPGTEPGSFARLVVEPTDLGRAA